MPTAPHRRHQALYAALLGLYPSGFRRTHGPDIVQVFGQVFGDRLRDHGARATWSRTLLDLAVTVPRYRLEALMHPGPGRPGALVLVAGLLVAALAAMSIIGPPAAIPLAAATLAVALAQRSALAPPTGRPAARRAALTWLVAAVLLAGLGWLVTALPGPADLRWGIATLCWLAAIVSLVVAAVRVLVPALRRPAA